MASPATRSKPSEAKAPPVLIEEPGASSVRTLDGKGLTVAIVYSRWYGKGVVDPLVKACADELLEKGVEAPQLIRVEVSGAFEIPFAASRLIQTKHRQLDAVVCIGCMVKGATMAFEFVTEAVAMAIMKLNVMTDTPVIFGVLSCASEALAKQCASTAFGSSHGVEWAQSALEMAQLRRRTARQIAAKCLCKCHCASEHCGCACHCSRCKCRACTCADCQCASCAGGKVHWAKATRCTGCGKTSESCDCVGCNCSACGHKMRPKSAP